MKSLSSRKRALVVAVDEIAHPWKELALRLHANPELGLQEEKACSWISDALAQQGFAVTRGVAGLETAFVARIGKQNATPSIAFLAEYDALPEMGHACGHNLIAPASCMAAIALCRSALDKRVSIQIIGCPAEEFFGGKARLLEKGIFKGIDAVLMSHGYFLTLGARPTIGRASVIFEFFGQAAHASTAPEDGINALDALLQTFNNVSMLRQQVRQEARIHGIITHGGKAANVIPDYTRAEFYVRSKSVTYLHDLTAKVVSCAKGASRATGARLKISSEGYMFRPVLPNTILAESYETNMRFIGVAVDTLPPESGYGSTDFGNVSQVMPALHGYFKVVNTETRPHSLSFASACRSDTGLAGMVNGAKAMALTAFDLIHRPGLLHAVQQEFLARQRDEGERG